MIDLETAKLFVKKFVSLFCWSEVKIKRATDNFLGKTDKDCEKKGMRENLNARIKWNVTTKGNHDPVSMARHLMK